METTSHNFDPADETLLTAYALGECNVADATAVERLLKSDPIARRAVDEVLQTAAMLGDALKGEPDVGLTAVHIAGIERQLASDAEFDAPHQQPILLRKNWGLWGSVAASTLIVATVMATVLPQVYRDSKAGQGSGGSGTGAASGSSESSTPFSSGSGGLAVAGMPGNSTGRSTPVGDGSIAGDWPILKTSAGGLPWPAVISRHTGFFEPAFVVAGDFPIAVIPPTPSHSELAGKGSMFAIETALERGRLPSPQSVRADELVNALSYVDPVAESSSPVSAVVESAVCPWNSGHLLVRVAIRTSVHPGVKSGQSDNDLPGAFVPAIVPLVRDLHTVVEVNPAAAAGYRVIGYENGPRSWGEWAGRDDDQVLPPGTAFTALLEVVPTGQTLPESTTPAEPRRYVKQEAIVVTTTELLNISVVYRAGPSGQLARLELPVSVEAAAIELASPNFRAAAGAAALGLSLRHSEPAEDPLLETSIKLLADVTATAPAADRQKMLEMARKVKALGR